MAREFQRGHKAKVSDLTAGTDLYVGVQIAGPGLTFDISCFGLDANEQLSDDRYFVFFNQPKSPEESIQLLGAQSGDTESFRVTLDRVPASIHKLSFTATIDGAGQMSQIGPGYIRIVAGGEEVVRYAFTGAEFSTERAVMLGDFYLKDVWRFAAVGQGFDGGLDALLKNFGGEVAEEQEQPQQQAPAAGAPGFAPPPQAAAPAPAPSFGAPAPAPAPQAPAPAPSFGAPPAAPAPAAPQPPQYPQAPAPAPVHAAPTMAAPIAPPAPAPYGQPPQQPSYGQVPGQVPGQYPGQVPPPAPAPAPYGQQPGYGQVPGQQPGYAPQAAAPAAGLAAALQPYKEAPTGSRWTPQNQQLMRVDLSMGGQAVLARQGSMVLYQGKVDFSYKGAGFAGRIVGNATGQEMQLMRCTGRGQVFLAENGAHLHAIELQGDAICVSAENVLAFDESLQHEVRRIEGHGIPGGALFTMQFQGTGTVIVKTHGTPVVLPVTPTTFADSNAIVAWSAASQVILSSQVRLRRNAYPGHSGETVNLQFRGAPGNFIVVQPYEV
ncbi:TerD family protein [Streptomyces yangpuensis]|uniref:TerD family protein n=1 Tax=Streptomyces yangpuensis TaxID=1648182 RepID=A0ABY5Q009_9ACTN|nr:TerD family protein [Streptomyces yangpuensis]MBZ9597959.1 TerD family protein [Streptomyces erythrochromogenes]UUY49767.1 TerD family protein [Streptomyces yangpuensis]